MTRDARLLAIGMITLADDEGWIEADAETIQNELYPADSDVSVEMIQDWLDELAAVDAADPFIVRYLGPSKVVVCFPKFRDHQPAGALRKDRIRPSELKKLVENGRLQAEDSPAPEYRPDPPEIPGPIRLAGPPDLSPPTAPKRKPERTGRQATNDEILDAIRMAWRRSKYPEPSMAIYQEIATYCKDLNRDPGAVARAILSRANSKPDIYALKFARSRKLPPELESGPKLDDWQVKKAKNNGRKTGISTLGDVMAAATEKRNE